MAVVFACYLRNVTILLQLITNRESTETQTTNTQIVNRESSVVRRTSF